MHIYQISILLMLSSLALAFFVYIISKPAKSAILSAVISSSILATSNFIIEFIARQFDLYYTYGAFEIFGVPLSLTIMWFALGFIFCIIYSSFKNVKNPRLAKSILILISAFGGTFYDTKISQRIGLVEFKEVFSFYYIFLVWLGFTILTAVLFNLFLRRFRNSL